MAAPAADGNVRHRPLAEALIVFAIATLCAALLFQIARFVPFVGDNLQAFVAAVFIYLPVLAARRHGEDLHDHAFTLRPIRRALAFGLGGPAVVFPLFLIAFVSFYRLACTTPTLAFLVPAPVCARFIGWAGLAHPRAPADLLTAAFTQVVVVALPEELFFRGYLLGRLERALPPTRRLLGGGVGWALVLAALLFALGHVLVDFDPRRLAVFFPGLLFGWMRSATGSIAAGTIAHAGANLYIETLQRTFLP
jgi:membrane protease YdiL (CAAX protease family)